MAFAEIAYRRSPAWLQTLFLNGYAVRLQYQRYGPEFERLGAEWEESQRWESTRLREWQDQQLRQLVRTAYERIPFYRERYDRHGVDIRSFEGVTDLHRLPLLTKEEVRSAGRLLLRPGPARGLVHGHTSGTTGSPLSLWYDRGMCIINNVADWRQKRWGGMCAGDWCGIFLGRVIVPPDQARPPFWRTNYLHRQVWFSSFHMNEANLPHYLRAIRDRGLRFLEGYPSTLYIVAQHLRRRGERLSLSAVFTSSETLHAVQREAISEAFGCPVFDFYGLAERVVFAAECEQHDGKHLFDEYGVTEIVDDGGDPVPAGEAGWVVGTSLWNYGMPLIRYRTGDLSTYLPDPCTCGRSLGRIAGVTTKAEDIVVTPDGRFVSPSVLTHPFKPYDQITKSQLIQDSPDHLLVRLVAAAEFSEEHREGLLAGLRERLGEKVRIDLEIADEIPAERSGKFRWVISTVPHDCRVQWEQATSS
jgi:phenylacetate-CoA ligase